MRSPRIWEQTRDAGARPRSYWFSPTSNPVAQLVMDQWGIDVVYAREGDPGEALLRFMKNLVR